MVSSIILLAVAIIPISNVATRGATIVLVPTLWLLLLLVIWPRRLPRVGLGLVGVVAVGFVLAPGRPFSAEELRGRFCYVWGGESRIGIDCSGLMRRGLIDAALKQGLLRGNPRLVRLGLSVWWHDCTARDLGQGYRGMTIPILTAPSVNAIDQSAIQAGDLAVTASGVHVLAFIGNSTWIEADPTAHRVLIVRVPEPANGWFGVPVRVVRWRTLVSAAA
jgi:hypothetical protein